MISAVRNFWIDCFRLLGYDRALIGLSCRPWSDRSQERAKPASPDERHALEPEGAELPEQVAEYQRQLDATAAADAARSERFRWQIRRAQKRMAELDGRLGLNK